jgi:hypothetical protein
MASVHEAVDNTLDIFSSLDSIRLRKHCLENRQSGTTFSFALPNSPKPVIRLDHVSPSQRIF